MIRNFMITFGLVSSVFDLPLLVASIAVAAATFVLPHVPLGRSFGLAPVSAPVLLALGGVTVAYVASSELIKRMFFRRHGA